MAVSVRCAMHTLQHKFYLSTLSQFISDRTIKINDFYHKYLLLEPRKLSILRKSQAPKDLPIFIEIERVAVADKYRFLSK